MINPATQSWEDTKKMFTTLLFLLPALQTQGLVPQRLEQVPEQGS